MKNQLDSKHIKSVITDYLQSDPEGALLVNGKWGAGKTYFWKNEIIPVVKAGKLLPAYISLNGVRNLSDLEQITLVALLLGINKKQSSIWMSSVNGLLNILNKISEKLLDNGMPDIIKAIGLNKMPLISYVLCFDDFERCYLAPGETLGFINKLVEHQKLKVIILSDESRIQEKDDYFQRKEKVVKWVLGLDYGYDKIIDIFFERIHSKNKEFFLGVSIHKPYLNDLLSQTESKNIRTLYFIVDILEKVWPCINQIDEIYQKEVLLFIFLISIEFKKGNLHNYEDPRGLDQIEGQFFLLLATKDNNNTADSKKESYAYRFFHEYIYLNSHEYRYYDSLFKFILTGFFNKDKFTKELIERIPWPINKAERAKRKLLTYDFRHLNEKEFLKLCQVVWDYAIEGEYNIYAYAKIAHFYYFFSEKNLIDNSIEDVFQMVFSGVEKSKKNSKLDEKAYETLVHFPPENPKHKDIRQRIIEYHHQITAEKKGFELNQLIEKFKEDINAIDQYFNEFKFQPELFRFSDNEKLANSIWNCDTMHISRINERVKERYSSSNIKEFLSEDLPTVQQLKSSLLNMMEKEKNIGKLKRFLIYELINELDAAIEKLT